MLLSSFISQPQFQFLGRVTSSAVVFMTVHSMHTSNFLPKILNTGITKRFCCDQYWTNGFMKL